MPVLGSRYMYACMSMLQCKVWSPYQSPRQNKKWTFKLNRASNWNWRQQENYRLINWCLSSTWGVSEKFLEKRPWLWQTLGQTWGVIYTQRSPCVKSSTQCRPPSACDDYRHCYHFGCFPREWLSHQKVMPGLRIIHTMCVWQQLGRGGGVLPRR